MHVHFPTEHESLFKWTHIVQVSYHLHIDKPVWLTMAYMRDAGRSGDVTQTWHSGENMAAMWSGLVNWLTHQACGRHLERACALYHTEVNDGWTVAKSKQNTVEFKSQCRAGFYQDPRVNSTDTFTLWPPHNWNCSGCKYESLFISEWKQSSYYFFLFQWLYQTIIVLK